MFEFTSPQVDFFLISTSWSSISLAKSTKTEAFGHFLGELFAFFVDQLVLHVLLFGLCCRSRLDFLFVYFLLCSFIHELKLVFNCELLFIVGIILDFSQFPSTKDPISRHYVVPQVLLVVKVKQLLLTLVTIIVLHLKKRLTFFAWDAGCR